MTKQPFIVVWQGPDQPITGSGKCRSRFQPFQKRTTVTD